MHSELSDDNYYAKDYFEAVKSYIIASQIIAEFIKKYIDKNEMQFLSESKEYIASIETRVMQAVIARVQVLGFISLIDDEMFSIMDTE